MFEHMLLLPGGSKNGRPLTTAHTSGPAPQVSAEQRAAILARLTGQAALDLVAAFSQE